MEIIEILFVFTLFICASNGLSFIAVLFGRIFNLPYYKQLDPRSWFMVYPAAIFQIWFWVDKSNLFN